MSFAAPLWLLWLIPWGGVVALLLWGRLKRVKVPFLELWKGPEARPRQRRAMEVPPVSLLLAILAMLLAILASARPGFHTSGRQSPPLTLIVDRGITMSGRGKAETRYLETIDRAGPAIRQNFSQSLIELQVVPGGAPVQTDFAHWSELAKSHPPTALDTRQVLRQTVLRSLADTDRPILVLSDQPLAIDNPRVIQIRPSTALHNVGIVRLAVRQSPTAQLMVRLRNQSTQSQARLRVLGDDQVQVQQTIELPAKGERDYFLDVPQPGRAVQVQVDVEDDLPADNNGYLIQQQAWPKLETLSAVPAELQRVIELYTQLRPAGEGSKRVAIVNAAAQLPTNQPAAVVAAGNTPLTQRAPLQVADHPITKAVGNWSELLDQASAAAAPDDPTWQPIVQCAGQVLVAVREHPAPAVWVGFHSPALATRPEFVVFWTNIFNWLGQGAEVFASQPVQTLGPEWNRITPIGEGGASSDQAPNGWWPGFYRRADGALLAVNAFDVQLPLPPAASDETQTLAQIARFWPQFSSQRPLAKPLILAALLALLLAAVTWPRNSAVVRPNS